MIIRIEINTEDAAFDMASDEDDRAQSSEVYRILMRLATALVRKDGRPETLMSVNGSSVGRVQYLDSV